MAMPVERMVDAVRVAGTRRAVNEYARPAYPDAVGGKFYHRADQEINVPSRPHPEILEWYFDEISLRT
jgi:hypothetical protein